MNVFYSSDIKGSTIILKDQEATHCSRVLRKSKGAKINVIDGLGHLYHCEIASSDRRIVNLNIISKNFKKKNTNLPHLAFGLIKSSARLEWMIEKITEIGIGRITPIICQRSERKNIKRERLEKIIISATKQSLNYYLPILDDPVQFNNYITDKSRISRYVASYGENVPELTTFKDRNKAPVILIGPEGDFTDSELEFLTNNNYKRVNLGESRLRAETACIVGVTLLRFNFI